MQIRFLEIAQIELDEAIDYYNYEESGLGEDFLTEVLNLLTELDNSLKHGIIVQSAQEGVKQGVFHTELYTRYEKIKY